jgi:hypothetical protein
LILAAIPSAASATGPGGDQHRREEGRKVGSRSQEFSKWKSEGFGIEVAAATTRG